MAASTDALLQTVEALASVPHRMKVVLYVSVGPRIPLVGPLPYRDSCAEQAQALAQRAIRAAQLGNVLIYGIDPSGLKGEPLAGIGAYQLNFLTDISVATGGRAILRTNDVASKMHGVLDETGSYYLLGYERPAPDGENQFHRIDVRVVGHPEWQVSFRHLRQEPMTESTRLAPSGTEAAIGGFVSDSNLQLSVSAAAFAESRQRATVRVSVRITLPLDTPIAATDEEDLVLRAFTIDGRPVAQVHAAPSVRLFSRPIISEGKTLQQAMISLPMSLAPGRYELRLGVHSSAAMRAGSVYTDVTVPDFFKERVSLSGVVLLPVQGSVASSEVDLSLLEPIVSRTFSPADPVEAFVRVYRGAASNALAVSLRTQILDNQDRAVFDRREELPSDRFRDGVFSDYRFRLPLDSLKPGTYCLTIDANAGATVDRRSVIFNVQ
jgi:hypothetical protein